MRVLELSDVEGAAAYAGKLFARWGSEVIRVESSARLTPERALDLYLNGGKQRLSADYRLPADREAIDQLAATCDIFLTDADARDVRQFGLLALGSSGVSSGPAVRVSITPFGLSGPYADFPATPATLLALGGYTYFMGDPDRAPLTMPGNYPYYQAGGYAYVAALAAALRAARDPDCPPTSIEVSILECLVSLHQMTDTRWIDGGHVRGRHGSSMEVAANTMLPVKDGWVGISVGQQFWAPFAKMLGRPEVAEPGHPMASAVGRANQISEVAELVTEAFKDWPADRVFSEGQGTWRVPLGRLSDLAGVLADPHLEARNFWRPIVGEDGNDLPGLCTPGSPFRFAGAPQPTEYGPLQTGVLNFDLLTVPHETERGALPATRAAERAGLDSHSNGRALARPLAGIRVLDLTRIWAGPAAGRMLADLGAHVIKIEEATGRGAAEVPRGSNGYQSGGEPWEPWNHQSLFNKLNRNRESICLNLKKSGGRELFLRLVAVSDVVLENFSARAMGRLVLGYDQLRAANERIILVPMPAFGKTGPYCDFIGLGPSVEPLAGLPSLMGYVGGDPKTSAKAIPDAIAAVAGAVAVLTALERRERTGMGMEVDLSQHEGAVASIGEYFIERQLGGVEPVRFGNGHPRFAPHGIYRCSGDDNWIAIVARDDAEWSALLTCAEQRWAADQRFATTEARREHRDALDSAIESWTAGKDKFSLMDELATAGVPAGAVLKAPEYLADRHLQERGYFADVRHPETGIHRYDGSPLVFHAADRAARGYESWLPPPKLGEHNWTVLHELLGMGEAEYQQLIEQGVLAGRPSDSRT